MPRIESGIALGIPNIESLPFAPEAIRASRAKGTLSQFEMLLAFAAVSAPTGGDGIPGRLPPSAKTGPVSAFRNPPDGAMNIDWPAKQMPPCRARTATSDVHRFAVGARCGLSEFLMHKRKSRNERSINGPQPRKCR